MNRIPATDGERRRHSAITPPSSDRQATAQTAMFGFGGSPARGAGGATGRETCGAADRGRGRWVPGLRRCAAVGCPAGRADRCRRRGGDQLGLPQHIGDGIRVTGHRLGRQRPGRAGRYAARRVGRRRDDDHRDGDPGASGRGPGRRRPGGRPAGRRIPRSRGATRQAARLGQRTRRRPRPVPGRRGPAHPGSDRPRAAHAPRGSRRPGQGRDSDESIPPRTADTRRDRAGTAGRGPQVLRQHDGLTEPPRRIGSGVR